MELSNKFQGLLKSQKEILKGYEEIYNGINSSDIINENIKLKKELDLLKKDLQEAEKRIGKLDKENLAVKASLRDQMLRERTHLLNSSKSKMEVFFKSEISQGINRIEALENSAKSKMNELKKISNQELLEQDTDLTMAIDSIRTEIENKIKYQKEKLKEASNKAIEEIKMEYDLLKNEGLNEETIARNQKHNDLEVKIGLNWINRIGIILLLFGVATVMKYTYTYWFNDYMKSISGFLFGGTMLAIGEWFNKRNKNLFALGLCGGGIGVLYLTVFSSYFLLRILNLPISIVVSILITLGSIALSLRYNSRTIAAISLIGGYLPFFSIVLIQGISSSQVYIAMGYLIILNLLVLAVSVEKRWIFINYISFLLNMPCMIFLSFRADNVVAGILYGLATFLLYLCITLAYPLRKNIKLKIPDLILLGLNTVINCVLVYILFVNAGLDIYMGFLALVYALSYYGLSRLIHFKTSQEIYVKGFFSITALTFSILMIPFQFGVRWASMGWLIEAILMLTVAKRYKTRELEMGGWAILGLCTLMFFLHDFPIRWAIRDFGLRYTFITFSLIYIFIIYLSEYNSVEVFKNTLKRKAFNFFKYFTIINTWAYLLTIITKLYPKYLATLIPYLYNYFYRNLIIAVITMVFAYLLTKIEAIRDKVVLGISVALLIVSCIMCMGLNAMWVGDYTNTTLRMISINILIIYNIFVFFTLKDLLITLIKYRKLNIEFYPIISALYLLGVITLFLNSQFRLQNINLITSIVFIIMAFSCIWYGFKKGYLMVRRFGLGLSIFSTGKLFIIDLFHLSGAGKIIAYFCFGLVLLGISFIYQRLRNSLEEGMQIEK